jgi:1-acyl-sn-glycerol-3-phosphate acyltransferase
MIKTIFMFAYVGITVLLLIPIGTLAALFGLLGPRRLMSVFIYRVAQVWARLIMGLVGCKITVLGRENIPRKGGVCFVSNHGSIFDIVLLLGYAGRPFGFVAKKELLLFPFLNIWISVLGGLFIDRKNPRKALKTINAGVMRIKKGAGMLIFPEGHRSRGQGLLPFHSGALKLATLSSATIVPVALKGTYEIFEKNYRVNPGPVNITFCKPINVADIPAIDRKQTLANQLYGTISEALEN